MHSAHDAVHSQPDVEHRMRCIVRASDAVADIGCGALRTWHPLPAGGARGALPGGARGLGRRGRNKRSPDITDPLDFRPAEVPNARYGIADYVARHMESARGRFWCAGRCARCRAPAASSWCTGCRDVPLPHRPVPSGVEPTATQWTSRWSPLPPDARHDGLHSPGGASSGRRS
ncbi:hypothetical protein AMK09_37805 [Streptomyces sp. CB02488]|nr:hypothetical protein AMK09_37805 [Streptomyces sp. CB02488]